MALFIVDALVTSEEVQAWQQAVADGMNPKDVKMAMAKRCVSCYYDDVSAEEAETLYCHFQKQALAQTRESL